VDQDSANVDLACVETKRDSAFQIDLDLGTS